MKKNLPAIEGGNPVREDFLVFGQPYIGQEEINEVVHTLKSCWIGAGPKVRKFEEILADYLNVEHVIALNSCTSALHLSMVAFGIGRGDEVITTPMTFCATANSIVHTGARPVFVDIDLDTMNISPREIEKAITPRTRAILPVHFAGRPCDMEEISNIAKKNNFIIIEDAAHAIGAEYKGIKIGGSGNPVCFSFYANKNITTAEGGAVATDNNSLADKIRTLSLHGMSIDAWRRFSNSGYKHYSVKEAGFKYNMTDIQASLGIHQLHKIEGWRKKRAEIWEEYTSAFKGLPIQLPAPVESGTKHARHLYTIILKTEQLTKNRDYILDALQKENIGVGVHYTPLHLHPLYRREGYKKGDFPHTEYIGDRTISLPLSAKLNKQDVEDVISAVTKILSYYKR